MDFTVLEKAMGFENVLVISDVFTKFTLAIPTVDQTAKTVAKVLARNFFYYFGICERIHSDRGRSFDNFVIAELCKLFGLNQSFTSPYNPKGNSVVERFNRTFHKMLKTLEGDKKKKWPEYLPELCYIYNSTPHSSTGVSPHMMMYGRSSHLPIDLILPSSEYKLEEDWSKVQQHRLQVAWSLARKTSEAQARARRERALDSGAQPSAVLPRTKVFLRNRPRGRAKIQDAFSPVPYVVLDAVSENTYRLIRVDGLGSVRTARREDLLLTDEILPLVSPTPVPQSTLVDNPSSHSHRGSSFSFPDPVLEEPDDQLSDQLILRSRTIPRSLL